MNELVSSRSFRQKKSLGAHYHNQHSSSGLSSGNNSGSNSGNSGSLSKKRSSPVILFGNNSTSNHHHYHPGTNGTGGAGSGGGSNSVSYFSGVDKKEAVKQCFLFSNHLIVTSRSSSGKLHLSKVS